MKTKNSTIWLGIAGLFLLSSSYANAQCTVLSVSRTSITFTADGGSATIDVTTDPSGCTDYYFSQLGTFFTASKTSFGISISCNVNSTEFSRSGRVDAGDFIIQINQEAACPAQAPPGDISGTSSLCVNTSATYTTTGVSGANYYAWSVSNGQIVSGQGTLSAVISFPATGSVTVYVTARNSCLNYSSSKTFAVSVLGNPAAPTSISHNPTLCAGNNYTFSVTAETSFTYEWTVEGTNYALLDGQGTSSIYVKVGSGSGFIKVKAINSSGCKSDQYSKEVSGSAVSPIYNVSGNGSTCPGTSTTIHLDASSSDFIYTAYRNDQVVSGESPSAVISQSGNNSPLTFGPFTQEGNYTIKASASACDVLMNGSVLVAFKPATPGQPGTITQSASTLCINATASFSIIAVDRATSYTWSTSGSSTISGQGTTNANITFLTSGSQTVYVTASNECGTSAAASTPITIVANPAAPTSISHNPTLCAGNNYTFSVTAEVGFTYEWAVEGVNYQLLDGQGTSSIQVKVGSGSGFIKVKAINSSGCKSDQYSKEVSGSAVSPVYNVSGNGAICPGASTTIHLDQSLPDFIYTAYRNDQVVSGESSSSVISQSGNNSSLTFGPFTQEGNYTIKASASACDVLMNGSVLVAFKPATPDQPGIISGTLEPVCKGNTSAFSILQVDRATQYTWSVTGGTVVSQTGLEAQILFTTTSGSSTVSVTADNECGISAPATKLVYVTHVETPVFLASHPSPCAGGKYTYRVDPVQGHIYEWEVPEGWEILGGQGESSVQIKAGRYDGTIKVTARKGDCRSQTATMFEDILEPPGVFGLTGSASICEGESFTLSLSGSVEGYNYMLMLGNSTVVSKPGTNASLTFGPYTTPGTYKVFSNLSEECLYPMDGQAIITTQTLSVPPTSIVASTYELCANENVILTVYGGILGRGASWQWYEGACGGNLIGTGSSISVKPLVNTTYYVRAEGICNTTSCVSASINVVACLDRAAFNYVRVRTPLRKGYATLPANPSPNDITTEYLYMDELGRKVQNVTMGGSPSGNDLFAINAYDQYGRERMGYLPGTVTGNSGMFINDAMNKIIDFYSPGSATHPSDVAGSSAPYAETVFEASSLNRIMKNGAPGTEWQPDTSSYASPTDRAIHFAYESNSANEVLLWTHTSRGGDTLGLINATSGDTIRYYEANSLYKNKTKDEQRNEVIEYIDKEGRTVLKKVQSDATGYAQTYYVYDEFDNLTCVIPPEAVRNILSTPSQYFGKSDAEKESLLNRWAFRYKYDARKRMTIKKVPAALPVYMVYDNRDRLVLTQDGNQRATSPYLWTFTKYDELNRPILTGIKDTAALLTQADMQGVVNYHYTKPLAKWGETYGPSEPIHGYSNNTYPMYTSGALVDPDHYLTVSYYDNYDFRGQWLDAYTYTDEGLSQTVNGVLYDQPDSESLRVIGQITGSKVKVLDGGVRGGYTWLKTIRYFDEKYRLIQSIADNYKGGQDKTTNLYDFTGKILKTKLRHSTREISWTDLVNAVVAGNNLLKTSLANGWNAGAVTAEQLPAGVDGWIECIISQANQKRAFGLTATNEGEHRNTIDYAFWHDATAAAIFENGSLKYTLPEVVKSGDVIRIERIGTTVKYYKNGQLLYTSLTPSSTALIGDASIDSSSGNILVPRASFVSRADSVMRRFVYDHAGRLTEVWHQINAAPEVRIAYSKYNEVGQLIDKKLHSTDQSASNAIQSVDYRYNIRGWITGMNEDNLRNGDAGDPYDYFSFQLGYNNALGIGNEAMYNGNISGMKWSTNLGLSDEKMRAYTYSYDNMNRITGAAYKTGAGLSAESLTWSTPTGNAFSESGYSYDLNGNIMGMTRKGKNGSDLDILTYDYGIGNKQSNQLLKVSDAASKTEGFTEIVGEGDDYRYDNNGNLVWDKNKGGEEVLQNGGFTYGSASWIVNDAGGRLIFQDDSLKVVAHATATASIRQDNIIRPRATYVVIVDVVVQSGNFSINIGNGGNKWISTTGRTVFTYTAGGGDDFILTMPTGFSGKINSIEVKGIVVISYNYLNLPEKVVKGLQQSLAYIYDASGRKLSQEVYDVGGLIVKKSDYEGEFSYENDTLKFINHEEGRAVMSDSVPEYQYHLKDHLGNVRLTFTTRPASEVSLATLETINAYDEQGEFLYYDEAIIVNYDLFDHTYDGTTGQTYYSTRLTGGTTNAIYGLAKSLSVMPGDTINMEVFAKYLDPDPNNWSSGLTAFMTAVAGGTAPEGTVVDGGSGGSIGGGTFPFAGMFDHSTEDATAPKAYLNFIVFDRDFNPIIGESGFIRITTASKESGGNVPHDKLQRNGLVIKEAGYVYIYLSNENETEIEVYFDDFRVEHIKSPVVQMDDYFPFGLTFNSYQRENSIPQDYKYNGKEEQTELDLGWLDYGMRMYQPDLGRWHAIDPSVEKYESISPYAYNFNNPIRFVDIKGMDPGDVVVVFAGADLASNDGLGSTGNIVSTLREQYFDERGGAIKNFPSSYWSTNISHGFDGPIIGISNTMNEGLLDEATQDAYDYVLAQYKEGGRVVIYGYSYGGVLAAHLEKRLSQNEIEVDFLVTVDAAAGPESGRLDRVISENTKENLNVIQTTPSALGSRGGDNKRQDGSKNGVNNRIKVTYMDEKGKKRRMSHGVIDEESAQEVIQEILRKLNEER